MLVEDVDCSALAAAPEDGQFIVAVSKTAGANPADEALSNNNAALTTELGHGLCMVWGSAQRSDRSALGDQRVPVIRKGGGRFKTKFFLHEAGDPAISTKYVEGAPLTVMHTPDAVQGSADRLMLAPAASASGNSCWIVGYCVRVINDSQVSGTGEIEFYLYDQPRLVVKA
tara:strand:- start:2939 stop:3451 length:513 start_codon:yes stop_codon:yes gene_type:complete